LNFVLGTNTLGEITWTRNSLGNFEASSDGLFTEGKTFMTISQPRSSTYESEGQFFTPFTQGDADYLFLTSYALLETLGDTAKVMRDDIIVSASVLIEVYP